MARIRNRPGSVILDLLRSARTRSYRAGALIDAGALFGFSDNTMRVNLSRLMARGIIESPSRGVYRLSSRTDALNDFVERWRLGESRVRPWATDTWLFAHALEPTPETCWALDALGFRRIGGELHARPDNLAMAAHELRGLARGIGLAADVLLINGTPQDADTAGRWSGLWDPHALNRTYADCLNRLQASAQRLPRLPQDQARLECFSLGGEMIHRLAKDPLLPTELADCEVRAALWQAMLDYDRQGKEIWARTGDQALNHMPRPQLATAS
jgi:phenylacetic acid degradation operon negative regulatory protein